MPLRFDLFRPETTELLPLVICIHGGGWISGSKEDMRDVALKLASSGFAAACPNYRLAPLHPYPAAIEDIHAFVAAVKQQGENWGVDHNQIAALGHSAGGHLACMAGLTGNHRVNAVISSSAITDLTAPKEQHYPIAWEFLEEFMGGPYEANEEKYRQASPVNHVTPEAPRFLIVHGDSDDIVPFSQAVALDRELTDHGVPHEFHPMPREAHSYTASSWAQIERYTTDFLSDCFAHALR